jgi:hypothetical protein
MMVPEMLCGDTKTVVAACKRHLTRFKRGGSWVEMGPMIDVAEAPGLIMLDGPSPLLGGNQVRLYAPFREMSNAFSREPLTLDELVGANLRAFDEALQYGWSVLGLTSMACYGWLRDPERAERFLESVIRHWAELDAVGARYTTGQQQGEPLWDPPHLVHFALARRGVATERLNQPLPPGGIAALLPVKN